MLPDWPAPPVVGGVPEEVGGQLTGRVIVTKDGLAELGRFMAGVITWVETAAICLEAR